MKVLCVIPARGGSTRVKDKNIRPLAGVPLMAYTIRDAKDAKCLSLSVISTDDERIAAVAKENRVMVIMRPAEYAQNDSPIYPALRHAVNEIEKKEGWRADIVVWLQPNVPFREKGLIDKIVKQLIDNYEITDSVVTVYEVDQHPEAMKIIKDGILGYREKPKRTYFRTQELPKAYLLDGSVMAMKTSVLMNESLPMNDGHFYMGKMMPFIHSFPYTVEVDHEEDYFLLEYIIDRKLVNLGGK